MGRGNRKATKTRNERGVKVDTAREGVIPTQSSQRPVASEYSKQ